MNSAFISDVESGNLDMVRLSLSNELLLDPRGESYREMLKYASQNLPELFEPESRLPPFQYPPKEQWDNNYLNNVKNELDLNFSQEKLKHYEEVVDFVLKSKKQGLERQESPDDNGKGEKDKSLESNMGTNTSNHSDRNTTRNIFVTLSGGALALLAAYAPKSLLVSLGVIGAVTGGILLVKDFITENQNGKK